MSRFASRVLSALLLVVVSCSDSATSVRRTPIHLALAPQFSPQAQAIYKSLSASAITLDNVHVVVRAAAAGDEVRSVLKDTTIAFPATADQITIDLELEISGAQQNVVAMVELRQGTTSYFSGTQDFLAKQGATATAPEAVAMSYVGPGATTAVISINPHPATLAPLTSFQFTAQSIDAQGQPLTGLPLTWSTSDSTIATVSQTGVVTTTAKAGPTVLTVTGLNGVTGQATIGVQPVARLAVIAGDSVTGIVGGALQTKLQVAAFDANGNAVIGATITFAAVSGGSVSPTSATTDLGGAASTTMTLGSTVGTYAFTATVAGSPNVTARVAVPAGAAAAAALGIVGGSNQVDTVLATLGKPISVKVTDGFGNAVSQQAVDFQVTSGQATLIGLPGTPAQTLVHTTTDNTGTAQVTLVGGTLAGAVVVTATAPQTSIAPVTFAATLRPGTPTQILVVQQPSTTAQATITLGTQPRVQVADKYGNAVALAGLSIIATPTFDCSQGVCDRVVPAVGTRPSLTRKATTTTTQRRLAPTAPNTTRLSVPTAIAKTQSVSDTFPQGLGGKTQVTTDASGIAAFTDLSMNLGAGPWLLEFSDANESLALATSTSILVSPGPIESIVAWGVSDTSFVSATVDTLFPSVRVIDKVGNGNHGVTVTWTLADGLSQLDSAKTTTDVNGIATAGRWTFSFSLGQSFFITATPTPSNIENSPLSLHAFISLIGRVVPPTRPSTPR